MHEPQPMHEPQLVTAHAPSGATVLRVLRVALHAGFFLLTGVAAGRAFLALETGMWRYAAVGGAVVLVGVYSVGPLLLRRRRSAQVWLAAVTAVWVALLAVSPAFSWVAFPLFFVHLHLLGRRHAVGAVTLITALVVLAQVSEHGELQVAMVLGPVLGAAFAVVIALGYAALYTESEQRRRLIEDLTRTRAELASSQRQAGVAAERERLSREIHDTLAQGLSSIVLLLRSAEAALPPGTGQARTRVDEARDAASENLAEARRFVRDLAPPSLAGASLPQALERLCERTGVESGIRCRFRLDDDPVSIPSEYEVALLRTAQATLGNVVTHAQAATAVVTLGFLPAEVRLDIYDDGVGFAAGQATGARGDGTGYGLPALRERIAALGGQLEVESAPGAGTAVAVRLPLVTEAEHG